MYNDPYGVYPQYNMGINRQSPSMRAGTSQNNIIWVQGIEGAKAFQINPNSTVLLLDSENDCFYMKASDQYGICMPLKTFKFEEIVQEPMQINQAAAPMPDLSEYVKKDELQEMLKEIIKNEQPVSTVKSTSSSATQQW